ncbi:MAG: leucine-rich repeat domain-containing protein, partial [Bacteroidaceae bacterium]|nr:leucine-rich repeat domain-containing protein [Bacteroidaceae bacterium]
LTGAAFMGCTSLKKIILPAKLREIASGAFERCKNLSEVHISPMVETIGVGAFDQCPNIENVYVHIANAKDIKINQNTFSSWSSTRLHVPHFAYDTYYWDTQWSQFAHLDEFDDKYESFYSKNTITLDKNTGTITGTPDATLHENGGLIVNDEEKQELDEIQLKSDGTNGATLIPENTGNIKAKKVDITIKVKGNKWHFFCFPFDVPLSGMAYEGEYVWRRYDGAKRSRREGGWQNLAAGTTTLEAGRGYIFQGTADGELTLSIDNPEITASDVKTGLEVYPSDNSQDASWNFVGNPYVSYYSIDATTYSSPITIWNGTGYEAYRPGDDDYMFHPYQAFFVQTPVDATEIGFDATARESYEQSQTTMAAAKARRAARKMNVNRLLANLELFAAGDTTYMDKTRIVFNDKENMEYDAVSDAAKFMSSERAAEFYTLDSKNVQYAINERPLANGDVRLGFVANKAGEYRIAQSRSDVELLLVDHQEGITHNLGTGAYTFSSGTGIFDNRFTLKVNGQETGITELKQKTGIDMTVDGELSINGAAEEVTTTVYQLNGVLAGTIQGNGSLRLPKGIYAVKVGLLTLKVQI